MDVKRLREITSSGKHLYCVENKHTDAEKMITEFQIKNLTNNHNILYTTRALGTIKATEHFVSWYEYGENAIACLYSIDLDSLLVFSDIYGHNDANFFMIKDDYGLLSYVTYGNGSFCETSKIDRYFFRLKNKSKLR